MFDSILIDNVTGMVLNTGNTLLCIMAGLLFGLLISIVYLITTTGSDRSPNFALSLVILPAIVTIVIVLIGGNLARAFSMAGVFTLIRFRSVPGDSKDITFIFYAMAVGLSLGLGYITLGAIITVLIGAAIIAVKKIGFGALEQKDKRLKITIPEDMNFHGVFDDLFDKYTKRYSIFRVKTTNLGTLYEITYYVVMKKEVSEKEFIDELRCRNGNLKIILDAKINNREQL